MVEDEALDELGLDEVGVDAQEGELGEDDAALRDGPDFALEAEGREVVRMLAELPDLWDLSLSAWPKDSPSR